MADEPSPKWTVRTVIADALEELNPHVSGDAAYEAAEGVLSDVTAPEHRDSLVAWLVEAGVLVLDGVDERQRVDRVDGTGNDRHWWVEEVPLYRVGGTDG